MAESFERLYFPSLTTVREIGKEVTSRTILFYDACIHKKRPPVSETKWEGFHSLFILCFYFSLSRHQQADRLTTDMTRRRVKTRPPWVSCRIIFPKDPKREDWESVFSPFLSVLFTLSWSLCPTLTSLLKPKEETVNRPSSQKVWGLYHRSLWSLLFPLKMEKEGIDSSFSEYQTHALITNGTWWLELASHKVGEKSLSYSISLFLFLRENETPVNCVMCPLLFNH